MSLFFFFYQNVLAPGIELNACSSFVLGDLLDARHVKNWDLRILNVSPLTSHWQDNLSVQLFGFGI